MEIAWFGPTVPPLEGEVEETWGPPSVENSQEWERGLTAPLTALIPPTSATR